MASNALETSVHSTFTIEVLGSSDPRGIGVDIDDKATVTSRGELKRFYLTFQSIGIDTCVRVNFADGNEQVAKKGSVIHKRDGSN